MREYIVATTMAVTLILSGATAAGRGTDSPEMTIRNQQAARYSLVSSRIYKRNLQWL